MSEALAENSVEIRERFEVDNDMKAEWCLSKIRKIRQEQSRETEELERQMKFYEDQKHMIAEKADEEVAFFEDMLLAYFNNRVEAGFAKATKTKVSYKLPTGELKMTHREPEYEYKKGQKETIKWLKENNLEQYIRTKEETNWSELKNAVTVNGNCVVTADGEIVPGIEVIERKDEFSVEVK